MTENDNLFRLVAEHCSDLVWSSDLCFNFAFVSPSVEKITGFDPGQYLRLNLNERYVKTSIERLFTLLEAEIDAENDVTAPKSRIREIETEIYRADGSIAILSNRITLSRNRHGKPNGFIGVASDVSAVRQAEHGLIRSETLMKHVMENMRCSVAVHDKDMRYMYVSRHYLEEYRVDEKDVIGKHHYDVFPDLPQKWRDVHSRVLKGEILTGEDDPYERADGSVDITRWECRPWYEPDGSVGGLIVYTEIINERKKIEEALRSSEEHYHRLFDTMTHGVIYHSSDGSIISANPAAQSILGRKVEDISGIHETDPVWDPVHEDGSSFDPSELPVAVALRTLNPAGPATMGIYNPKKMERVWISVSAVPLIMPGESLPFQVYSIFQDISDTIASEKNYTSLFNEMAEGILFLKDTDANGLYICLSANPAFRRMTGSSLPDLSCQAFHQVFPEMTSVFSDKLEEVATTGHSVRFQYHYTRSNRHFEITVYRNLPGQLACIFDDISDRWLAEEALKAEQDRANTYFDVANVMFVALDRESRVTRVNRKTCEVLELPHETVMGSEWFGSYLPEEIQERYVSAYHRYVALNKNMPDFVEVPMITASGKERILGWHNVTLRDDSGNISGVLCSGIDITEQVLAEEALKESEFKYSSYIEFAPDGVFVTDKNGDFVEVNKAACNITGYTRDELLDMNISQLQPENTQNDVENRSDDSADEKYTQGADRYRHKDGSVRWWILNSVRLNSGRSLRFAKDISDIKQSEDNLYYLSYHDQLTGVYNRRYFEEELRRLDTKRNLPMTLIMGDVNGLKLINDSFGHAKGDELLMKTAEVIKKGCRADDIIARFGGDEFAIILPKTGPSEADLIIGRIKALASLEKVVDIELSVSFGFDTKISEDQQVAETMINAEDNMYRGKLGDKSAIRGRSIEMVMRTLFEKSSREAQHSKRVSELCGKIAAKLGMEGEVLERIRKAGSVHDIGKIGVSENILNKPGKLSNAEYDDIRKHPETGWRILSTSSEFSDIADIVLEHQERWDGKGYPKGLSGRQISEAARIIAAADAFDAMTSDRIFKKGISVTDAAEELRNCAGSQLDPDVVKALIEVVV